MNEKEIKLFTYLVGVGIAVCAIIVAIDLHIKNDLVRLAFQTGNDLKVMQAMAGTFVPMEARNEQAPNGTSEMGTWPIRSVPDNLHASPVFRSTPRMEAGDHSAEIHTETPEAQPVDTTGRNSDSGIQEPN